MAPLRDFGRSPAPAGSVGSHRAGFCVGQTSPGVIHGVGADHLTSAEHSGIKKKKKKKQRHAAPAEEKRATTGPQMFTRGPYSSAQEVSGSPAVLSAPPLQTSSTPPTPYASSQVVLPRPYITLTPVQPLKRPDGTSVT